jgi:hypothetical protein
LALPSSREGGKAGRKRFTPPSAPNACGSRFIDLVPAVGYLLATMGSMTSAAAAPATQVGVPTYLLVPGADSPLPPAPVQTLVQDLPLHQLTWENFERLCLRVIESESTIEQCLEYGTRGQDQHGIDLLARNRNHGGISVYQCKRVKTFGPASIETAVTRFLEQSWAGIATSFVLCTSNDLRTTDCADEIVLQEKRLLEYKTGFEVWSSTRISGKLKKLPELVYDFFGPAWLVAFCGREYERRVSKRLTPQKVDEYRRRLLSFYRTIFEQNDPGIPTLATPVAPRIDLSQRFVLPQLVNNETVLSSNSRPKPDAFDLAAKDDDEELGSRRLTLSSEADTKESREVRFSVDEWISSSKRSLVVGAAGSGKTTLLRYILLDVLSAEPVLPAVAEQFGRHLPIWIPFAYWTHTLHRQQGASIVDVLRGWFHSWGQDALFSLVEEAIADERLFLVVDGLDEWADEPTGSLAFAQFQSFLDMHGLPALSAARPYALNWLKLSGSWRISRVAALTAQQREAICRVWFGLRARSTGGPESLDGTQHEVSSLITDLEHSADLDELSRIPLFLLLLIALRFQGAALPAGRFDAYEALIRHMLRDHPQRKRSAAAIIPSDQLSERELRTILARLAYDIQVHQTGGTISEDSFESILLELLTSDQGSGLGLPNAEARRIAKGFLNIEEGSLGLLVPQGMRTFGFLHRSLQERLAAVHCSGLPLDKQTEIVRVYASNPQWRETLLHLCSLTSRPDELSMLLSAFLDVSPDRHHCEWVEDFRIEVAFSDFDLPLQELREIAALAFKIVEHSTDLERRRRILRHCLNGLQARRTQELVNPKLNGWSVARSAWRGNWIRQLELWPADDLTKAICQLGLNDEEISTVRESARTYAKVFRANSDVANELVRRAGSAQSLHQRAACIEAVVSFWPDRPELAPITQAAKDTEIPLLELVGIYAAAKGGEISQEDTVIALDLAGDRLNSSLPHEWRNLLGPLLVEAAKVYPSIVKQACLYSVEGHLQGYPTYQAGVDRDVAWFVLASSYSNDTDVISLLAKQMQKQHPFLMIGSEGIWAVIASNFRGTEEIVKAMDARIGTFNAAQVREAHYAALLTRSEVAKKKMLEMLHEPFPHWAASALVDGWGMVDHEVASALRGIALGQERLASELGFLIPEILGRVEGRTRLLELMKHPEAYRRDFIIAGLFKEASHKEDEELVSEVIQAIEKSDNHLDKNLDALIAYCPQSPQVRALALQDLKTRTPSVAQIAAAYPNDWEVRSSVAAMMNPLPRELRSDIAASLARSGAIGEQANSILSHWDFESDPGVKTKMSVAYHAHLSHVDAVSTDTVESLTLAAKSYGPDHHDRRQAAFCGITLLRKFDIYFEHKETIGEPTSLSVPLERGIRSNYPFLDFIALHWTEIKAAFGDDLLRRFSRFTTEANSWSTLLSVAHQNAEMVSDAERAIEEHEGLQTSAQGLRFLAKTKPRSPQLRSAALKAINSSVGSWTNFLPLDAACEILLDQFKDEQLFNDLLDLDQKDRFVIGPMMVLCLGWPDSTPVQSLLPNLNSADQIVAAYAFFSSGAVERIVEKLPGQLHRATCGSYWGRYIRRPLVLRLERDPALGSALFEDMIKNPTHWKKCAYAHAVARTQGLTQPEREWVLKEYEQQNSLAFSEFGYDVIQGELRSVVHSLKDALHR